MEFGILWRDLGFDFFDTQSSMDSSPPSPEMPSSLSPEPEPAFKRRKVDDGLSGFQVIPSERRPIQYARPRKSGGPLTLRRAKPIKSHIPNEIWLNIFSFCTPQTLAKLRRVNSTFKSFIDDERIWATSRKINFPHFPEPIYGYPENYMWILWRGMGCMICGAARVRKIYWTWGIRMCFECFKDGKMKADEIYETEDFCQNAKKCLRHCFISGRSVATERDIYYGGEPAYWRDEVQAFKDEYFRRKKDEDPEVLKVFLEFERNKTVELMKTAKTAARREEIASIRKQRNVCIPEKCKTDFDPPISEEVLLLMPSYSSALKSGSAFTERSWKTLAKKLQAERKRAEVDHNSKQALKRKILQDAVDRKREERQKECRDNKALQIINLAMRDLLDDATDCILTESGALVLDRTRSASFLMETLGYIWRSWLQKNPDLPLSMRGIFYLWETRFAGLAIFQEIEFKCEFCEHRAGFKAVLNHIAEEHGNREESVKSWCWARETPKHTDFLDWDGAIWPEVLPFLPAGSKFTPRLPCDERWCLTKSYPVVKQSKGWKPGSVSETISLRLSIDRCLGLVTGLDVPPVFKLAAFLANLSNEESPSRRLDLNSVYYEILRVPDDHDVEFLSNDKIFCKTCVENKTPLLNTEHPGHGDFLQLITHFCEKHYSIIGLEKPEGLDWKKDMILLPGPKDIKTTSKRWDRVNGKTGLDLESCEAMIEEEYAGNRAPSLPMSLWKYNQLMIPQLPPTPVSPVCDPLDSAFWDVAIQMDLSESLLP
ncbi:hypothetical protein L873DRAFT_1830663 [Choiromyces venosus 120613-1]|uniref:F-box domain-containing protein n=1 Tax=Choiromyces venosus 120613-1 TaxID=1336337 RepID=A0A3N4J5L6_9PEZI|nr:hypothetical protein L873DRAFT_1830663 [Choiromyces venosus 120613-1]